MWALQQILLLVAAVVAATTPSPSTWRDAALCGTQRLRPFDNATRSFRWRAMKAEQTRLRRLRPEQLSTVADIIYPYITAPHAAAHSFTPPPLTVDCGASEYAHLLTGRRLAQPARIIDFVPLAHELDTLEIRLYELNDTVDMHIIFEGTHTHRGFTKKLFFAQHRRRFAAFAHKLYHFVADDADQRPIVNLEHGPVWAIENQMRSLPVEKFRRLFGDFRPTDLILNGDCDEVPSRRAVAHMRQCELRRTPLRFTLDFYIFSFNWLFSESVLYFPALSRPADLVRMNGILPRGNMLVGAPQMAPHNGAHMNRFMFTLLDKLFKEAAMAEDGTIDFTAFSDGVRSQVQWLKTGVWQQIQPHLNDRYHEYTPRRVHPSASSNALFVPWFARQNQQRFPWLFVDPSTIDAYVTRMLAHCTTAAKRDRRGVASDQQ